MELDLFCSNKITPERPNIISDDLIASFSLQKLFKDYKKKKQNRPLQITLKEIVDIEQHLTKPEFQLSLSEKQHLFS